TPSLSGPKRPQDRIELGNVKNRFIELFSKSSSENGFNKQAETLQTRASIHPGGETPHPKIPTNPPVKAAAIVSETEMEANKPTLASAQFEAPAAPSPPLDINIGNGDVLIAAITSCTNTS